MNEEEIKNFQQDLLSWYHKNKKNLPWRENQDAYKVWLSEIMSQQTQVETVIPYYQRFLRNYPTISDLAQAKDEELLKTWEGLGYYSRARNLKFAASQIMNEFSGEFPQSLEEIRSLKGIGPYSAASIASICFNLPEPAIDGNLFRVTSRLFEISDDISKTTSRKNFDKKLREIISHSEAGNFNQALMDLGSTICKPKSPKCEICPLAKYCQAYKNQRVENFPVKTKKIKQEKHYFQAFVLKQGEKYLMAQRQSTGLLASMWTFPLQEIEEKDFDNLSKIRVIPEVFNNQLIKLEKVGKVQQIYSHQKWIIKVIYCQLEGQTVQEACLYNQRWLSKEELKEYALAKAQIKMFRLLQDFGK
ncbi:MAG: A/G-specific adenine glycosylase [Lactovum sp.]